MRHPFPPDFFGAGGGPALGAGGAGGGGAASAGCGGGGGGGGACAERVTVSSVDPAGADGACDGLAPQNPQNLAPSSMAAPHWGQVGMGILLLTSALQGSTRAVAKPGGDRDEGAEDRRGEREGGKAKGPPLEAKRAGGSLNPSRPSRLRGEAPSFPPPVFRPAPSLSRLDLELVPDLSPGFGRTVEGALGEEDCARAVHEDHRRTAGAVALGGGEDGGEGPFRFER
jgi:hypothetical protein